MNCCGDIIVKKGNAVYYLAFLEWDTKFFGLNSYLLDEGRSNLIPEAALVNIFNTRLKNSFISIKAANSIPKEELSFLQDLGFKYIDLEVTLEFIPNLCPSVTKICGVRYEELTVNKGLPYNAIGCSFVNSRFHSDKRIDAKKADLLWVEYLKNYARGPGKHIFVGRVNNQIASVILVGKDMADNAMRLYFVATRKEFRNKGMGSGLVQFVADKFRNSRLLVGTYSKNIKALNFYLKNGFTQISGCKIVMHRWSN